MRDKITSTKHSVSVTVSNLSPIADSGAASSSLLSSSVHGEKGAYPRTILLSVTVSHWLCLLKSKMKASGVAMKS